MSDDVHITINVRPRRRRTHVDLVLWTFGPVQEQDLTGPSQELVMEQMSETQFKEGTVQPITKKGSPAQVQAGTSVFESTDPAVLKVEVDPTNELKVKCSGVAPGVARCRWSADADMGDGVRTIELFVDFSITAGQAEGGTILFGPPQEQP